MTPWPHFSARELRCRCGCGLGWEAMNPEFMAKLERLRWECQFPLIVSSAIRCAAHNAEVSTTGQDGPHTTGRAVDIAISGRNARTLIHVALSAGIEGVGIRQTGPHDERFIHLDDLTKAQGFPRPALWTY